MIRRLVRLFPLAALLACAVAATPAPKVAPLARYGLVLLRSGVRPPITPAQAESLQAGHMANILRMYTAGALDAAGPFGDATPLRGIFVFKPESLEVLSRLLAPDPLLSAGRLVAEPYIWRAKAGLSEDYRRRSALPGGAKDSMVTFTMVLLHKGPTWAADETRGQWAERESELSRQRASGRLVFGGPIEGPADLRGVYLYDADTTATRALVARDPQVQSGRLVPEMHPWWTAFGTIPGH
jgi:uncharacterized protein YciI